MPKQDGWSIFQELKSDPETESIPIIIVSVMEDRKLGFSLGVADYITKPFSRKILLKKLSQLHLSKEKKVLIVEDNEELNLLIQTLLRKEGFNVSYAFDGITALGSIQQDDLTLFSWT